MKWWDRRAGDLQDKVRSDELDQQVDYDDVAARRAIVHAREDIILLISYMSSANRQLWIIKIVLLGVLLALVYIAVRLS